MTEHIGERAGLTTAEAERRLEQYGRNELAPEKKKSLWKKILEVISEPMFVLLLAAAVIYFLLGEAGDGAVMLAFVVGVIGIDAVQTWKTDRTLAALRDLSAPRVAVVRDGEEKTIPSAELVPGDLLLLCEGVKIPADGAVVRCSDLCVDESTLTGEAEGVWKTPEGRTEETDGHWRRDRCYAGTLVTQGTAAVRVEATGSRTEYGRIGMHVAGAPDRPTPLEKQTAKLVKTCAFVAAALFALVCAATWFNLPDHEPGARLVESVLSGVTLAMAMIPEEFPVILTVFLSMGAWRLARKNSLVRRLPSVETLGAVSVLCVDKTGTITENRMSVEALWVARGDENELCETMGLACETEAYDPMEKAMLGCCEKAGIPASHLFGGELVTEYAFTNAEKRMGHVWRHEGALLIAAKGSPESILPLCAMDAETLRAAEAKLEEFSARGLRVIAVGKMVPESEAEIPLRLADCRLFLCGLVGLADPPRATVREDISACTRAGIRVVMITGDSGATASAVAGKIGMPRAERVVTGGMLERMTDAELREAVKTAGIFARVVPEHKMRIVKALRENGEIVAMTGDGVNDAPALRYADIGIAMGGRGSEVSREAADLVLMDDNFRTIVETVRDGRRIYDNIRKAMGYVLAIHVPIALSSLLAPMLGIAPADLFLLPVHMVLLELVIDPTCSVVLERQPAERDVMARPPRNPSGRLLTARAVLKSVLQGLVIFAAAFGTYAAALPAAGAPAARAMGLAVLMLSNLLLVQVDSSDRDGALQNARRMAGEKIVWAANLATLAGLGLIFYTPLADFLRLAPLSASELLRVALTACAAVLWYELVKAYRRRKTT